MHGGRGLVSPQEAVARLEPLIASADWVALAGHYDLSGSGLSEPDLTSGRFFLRDVRPPASSGHPSGIDRYAHPFPPGGRYAGHEVDGDRATVHVAVEIAEGGGLVSRQVRSFRLRLAEGGWVVLPEAIDPATAAGLIERWLAASERAYRARARSSLEAPRAEAEAAHWLAVLRGSPAAAQAQALRAISAAVRRTLAELEDRTISLGTSAREQTDEDRAEIDDLARTSDRLRLEMRLLEELTATMPEGTGAVHGRRTEVPT